LLSTAGVAGRQSPALALAGYVVRLLSRLPRDSRPSSLMIASGVAVIVTLLTIAGLAGWSTWHVLRLVHDVRFELLIQGVWDQGKDAVLPR
jgi:hypothetical protein